MPASMSLVARRPSTQDVSWFLDMNSIKQLELNPPYQRRSVWGTKDRRFFLDTIFRGFPCPPIYLHKTIRDGRSVYAVVDGKQRIETVLMFYNNRIALPTSLGDSRLNGKKWRQIQDVPELAKTFRDYVFPVEFVELPFNDPAYVNDVFDRLNRNSKILNQQELRHAKYSGWFIKFAEEEALDSVWQATKIWTKARSRRMLDVQFVSELMLVVIRGGLSGFSQEILDALYAVYDDIEDFDAENEWGFPPLQEYEFKEKVAQLKADLNVIVQHGPDVKDFLSDSKHLYSLWTYLLMHENDTSIPELTPEKFHNFVTAYNQVEQAVAAGENGGWDLKVYKYYNASRGATTEEPQRRQRQEALVEFMRESE